MGPKFQWMASHPGDPELPFDGLAPEGVLATRVLGAQVAEQEGGDLHFTIPTGGHVVIAVAAMDNRDTADYFHSAIAKLQQTSVASVEAIHTTDVAWWKQFWSKSFIEIPDKTIQSWYYGSLYVLASCSRHGNVPPGLRGNWITSTYVGWQGDYTLDYNYQAPFCVAFPTNHVDLADPYDAPILALDAPRSGPRPACILRDSSTTHTSLPRPAGAATTSARSTRRATPSSRRRLRTQGLALPHRRCRFLGPRPEDA